jgi:hypothetical protein
LTSSEKWQASLHSYAKLWLFQPALAVEPQQVVLGETEAADWNFIIDPARFVADHL